MDDRIAAIMSAVETFGAGRFAEGRHGTMLDQTEVTRRRIQSLVAAALADSGGDTVWLENLVEWTTHVATVLRKPYKDRMMTDAVLADMLDNALAAAGATGEGGGG